MASLPSLTAPMPLTDAKGRPLADPTPEPVGVGNSFEVLYAPARNEAKKERIAREKAERNAAKNAATASSSVSDVDATATVYCDAATVSSPRRGPRDTIRKRPDDEFDLPDGAHPRGLRLLDFVPACQTVVAAAAVFFLALAYFLSPAAPGAALR